MKSSKKILGASAALGLAVALSAGSTFAWFTAGNTSVKVNDFQLTATSSGGDLKVALVAVPDGNAFAGVPGNGYGSVVTLPEDSSDTATAPLYSLMNTPLQALTTHADDNGNIDGYLYGVDEEDQVKEGYMKLRLVFQSDVAMNIYLAEQAAVTPVGNANSITVTDTDLTSEITQGVYGGNEKSGVTDYAAVTGGYELYARAANASRVMFTDATDRSSFKIWSPNEYRFNGGSGSGEDDTYADAENKSVAGFWKDCLSSMIDGGSYSQKSYDGYEVIKDGVTGPDESGEEGAVKSLATPIATTKTGVAGASAVSGGEYFAVIDVAIWLEGTDGDCFNAIFSDKMSISLAFVGEAV